MLVLTPENSVFDMNTIEEFVPDEMYCALDLNDIQDSDYYFFNILNTVTFNSIAAELKIGDNIIQVPINWQILLGDEDTGMLETATIEDLLSVKEPYAYVYNPITSKYPRFLPVEVKNIYTITLRWQIPMLNKSHMLAVPLNTQNGALCAYFADETERFPDFCLCEM
jgi:hypothetical protein